MYLYFAKMQNLMELQSHDYILFNLNVNLNDYRPVGTLGLMLATFWL